MSDPDVGYQKIKQLVVPPEKLSEADTRVKIIDYIFKEALGWDEKDIIREEHVNSGYIDYTFKIGNNPYFLLEAKKIGDTWNIPNSFNKRKYILSGTITTDKKISSAIEQVVKYSNEVGVTYSIISNGLQFIIFENFKRAGKWRDRFCTVFRSLEDIQDNFTYFWNILSKESMMNGSLMKYISEQTLSIKYERVLDKIHNPDSSVGKNKMAWFLTPLINKIFLELTDKSQIDILEKCYIRQSATRDYDHLLSLNFDRLPHYAKEFGIEKFIETGSDAGQFQLSFEKCKNFLMEDTPKGSMMILLGGVGSGKTTFIHHFFKITLKERKDIVWFYVDFLIPPSKLDEIEAYIYESIIRSYYKEYSAFFKEEEKRMGIEKFEPNKKDIIILMSMLKYSGKVVSIVIDNTDQYSYLIPRYQEQIFEIAQSLTEDLRTITILNLREESFFRATKSGILDAYLIPKFHISSPSFEDMIRKRLDYSINLLNQDDKFIESLLEIKIDNADKKLSKMFFKVIHYSIRQTRTQGREILEFLNDISGGNMRQSLRFFNTFMTSGNTDVDEIFTKESIVPENAPARSHYQTPLHHVLKSIILEDNRYFKSKKGFIINIFQLNPEYSNSHFIKLKIFNYLNRRKYYFVALDQGFYKIDDLLYESESGGISRNAFNDSMRELGLNNLVEFNNQQKEGFDTASYVRITRSGQYYVEKLSSKFAYLDLMFGDTLINDENLISELRKCINYDDIPNRYERTVKRIERTEQFLNYLKEREERDFKELPIMYDSDLTNKKFMDEIISKFKDEKDYILGKIK